MSTVTLSVIALLWSGFGIAVLTRFDAKRQRSLRVSGTVLPAPLRALIWLLVLLPAVLLPGLSDYSALTNWIGGLTVIGLLIVFLLPSASTKT